MKTLMCIPNISEGRDTALIEQVVAAVQEVAGVKLIHRSWDTDHNRAVLAYLGEPEPVLAATQAMAAKAFELIDMSRHHGAHPRLGAVDVVPFVSVRGVAQDEAVEIARRFGRFVGALDVPVYYYEQAAVRPERVSLAVIRRGEYEGLAKKLHHPDWPPDEGPATFNPKSGGLVTGVRGPLVAFNVNLRTTDVSIARRIARAIRYQNGGYRFVRALGVALESRGLTQVSLNLLDYTRTPLPRVLETIRFEAARHGVMIAGTELIGPVPLGLCEELLKHYVQAHDFAMSQVVESALIE
jgi:glutamate formiminotransferase